MSSICSEGLILTQAQIREASGLPAVVVKMLPKTGEKYLSKYIIIFVKNLMNNY